MTELAIVVAVAANGVIGSNNELPWRLPEDLKYFKRTTMGHPIVMGRKTFDSIGKPLPGRKNIVVTRQTDWQHDGVDVVHNLEDAISLAKKVCREEGVERAMLIGGANLYEQALPECERLYLTEVHADVEGDAFFPKFARQQWREIEREDHFADDSNPYNYSFVVLTKK